MSGQVRRYIKAASLKYVHRPKCLCVFARLQESTVTLYVVLPCLRFFIMRLVPWAVSLAATLLCHTTFGLRLPVKDVTVGKMAAAAELKDVFHQHEKRLTCYEDWILQSLQNDPQDTDPFCSSFISIPHQTSTQTQLQTTFVLPPLS